VFVVDDDPSVRGALELLIRSAGWQPEVFASGQEFLTCPQAIVPSCLVLEVNLPDIHGLRLQELLADRMGMPIIFTAGHSDVPTSVRAMKAGAVEFLTKPFDPRVMLRAIWQALERSRTGLLHQAEITSLQDRYASLSPREQEVMELVASGLLNKEVGAALGISEITVKAHRGRMMRKMRADSLADLVNMAARLRLRVSPRHGSRADGVRGSFAGSTYAKPSGPIALT
jgi:FixJ family two-component response regulator